MSGFFGRVGPCFWSYGTGTITQDEWEARMNQIRAMSEVTGEGPLVRLTLSYRLSPPTLEQRAQLARFLARYMDELDDRPRAVLGHAFVTDSTILASTLAATTWILKRRKPFQERTFTNPRAGLDWLSTLLPALDPSYIWSQISAAVPQALFWDHANEKSYHHRRAL